LPSGIFAAWDPVIPWQNGKKDKPNGVVCKICAIVFNTGGWPAECTPQDLSGFERLISADPTRLHPFLAQRARYIEIRTSMPNLKARSDLDLGPRVNVTVVNSTRMTLEKPEEYFVDLTTYMEDNPGKQVQDSEKVHEFIDGRWVEGVNVRTGKKGYYKRTQAQDRSTNLNITVHDSDDSIGAAPDTHSKVFAASSKALTTTEAIDAMELPFFQLGHHPGALHQNRSALPAPNVSGNHTSLLQLKNGEASIPIHDGSVNDDPSQIENDQDELDKPAVNAMQMIHFAIPSHAKDQPKAKASARTPATAVKAAAKTATTKDKGKGSKRKQTDGDEPDSRPKIMKLAKPTQGTDPSNSQALVPQAFSDADAELLANFNESFTSLRKRVLAGLQDTDASINDSLKTCNKDVGTLMKTLKNKIKSMKRRQDHGGETANAIDNMISELSSIQSIATRLLSCQGDADIIDDLKTVSKSQWNISAAIFKRGFKCVSLYYLKFSDWNGFTELLPELGNVLGWTNGPLHFELMVSDVIQRLLRALPSKATWTAENLQPISSFFTHMITAVREGRMAKALMNMQVIVCQDQHVPSRVSEAVNEIHAAVNKSNNDDSGLSAVFAGICQGKQFLKNANTHAVEAQKEIGHLQELMDHLQELENFTNALPESTSSQFNWKHALEIGLNTYTVYCQETSKSSTSAAKTVLLDAKKKLSDFVSTICKAFLMGPTQAWIVKVESLCNQNLSIDSSTNINIDAWKSFAQAKLQGNASQLCGHAIDCEHIMKQIVDGSRQVSKADDTTSSLTLLVKLSDSLQKFRDTTWHSMDGFGLCNDAGRQGIVVIYKTFIAHRNEHIRKDTLKAIQQMSIIMAKVNGTSIPDESIKAADSLYEQFSLLRTCINDKALARNVWLLRTCKFMLLASNAKAQVTQDITDRSTLKLFLHPYQNIISMFDQDRKDSDSSISKVDHQKVCLEKIYGLLKKCSQFHEAFPSVESFQEYFEGLVSHATDVFNNRKHIYDKDSQKVSTQLASMLKKVPELDPEDTAPFVAVVKSQEKSLLTECQKANEIISAIEEDKQVFVCQADDICTNFIDLKTTHHRATTILAEHSGAVLCGLPAAKVCLLEGVPASGRVKDLLTTLVKNCQEKQLEINPNLLARVTSLLGS